MPIYADPLITRIKRIPPVHDAVHLRAPRHWLGGVYASLYPEHAKTAGVNVHIGIFPELEHILPDYEIVPERAEMEVHSLRGAADLKTRASCGIYWPGSRRQSQGHRSPVGSGR